ncbi:hypothetical protein J0L31_11415 [Terrisporobacter glycolicus]|nr:hypothetical protein [Terrisporobacter glycolicus]
MNKENKEQRILQEQEKLLRPKEYLIDIDEQVVVESNKELICSSIDKLKENIISKHDISRQFGNLFASSLNSNTVMDVAKNIIEQNEVLTNGLSVYLNSASKFSEIIKPVSINFNNTFSQLINSAIKTMNSITTSIGPMLQELSNVLVSTNFNKALYRLAFEEHKDAIYKFYYSYVFPPINYLIDNEVYELDPNVNIEEYILSKEINEYYVEHVKLWADKFDNESSKRLISDIAFNLEHKRDYAVSSLVFTLIEHLLNYSTLEEYQSEVNGKIYPAVRNMLKEEVFKPLNINALYIRFIKDNLYTNTDIAIHNSRHIVHGKRIELNNMMNAMSMIFLYDFIQEIIEPKPVEEGNTVLLV